MYDFWYTLGVSITKPELLQRIQDEGPEFEFLLHRIVADIPVVGAPNVRQGASAGLLGDDLPANGSSRLGATTRVRSVIGAYLREFHSHAPPVGIYTAGRFSQLLSIEKFDEDGTTFVQLIESVHQGYRSIEGHSQFDSHRFPAFLGVCFMDKNLTDSFSTDDERLPQILDEFKLSDRDFAVATALIETDEFQQAYSTLQDSDFNPWTDSSTLEQIYFWPDVSTYAIP